MVRCFVTRPRVRCVAAAALLALVPIQAMSVPITFQFTGYGNCGAQDPCPDYLGDTSMVSGSFTFDSEAMDLQPADDTLGWYLSSGGPYGVRYQFGDLYAEMDFVGIEVEATGAGFARYYVTAGDFNLQFVANDNGWLTDDLPLVPPDLSVFDDFWAPDVTMRFPEYQYATFATLETFTVLEPGMLALLSLGALVLAGRVRSVRSAGGAR